MIDVAAWGWPQLTYVALLAMGFGVVAAKHGEPRDPYSIWWTLVADAIVLTLLTYGGFFA